MSFENDRDIKSMDLSDYCFEVVRLASLNKTPKEIEIKLGLDPYSIHKKFHTHLMTGYKLYFDHHKWNTNMNKTRQAFIFRLNGRLNKLIAGIDNDE